MNESKDKDKEKEHDRGVLSHIADIAVGGGRKGRDRGSSAAFGDDFRFYKASSASAVSCESLEIITVVLETGEWNRLRQSAKDDQIGTQRVYKKSSPNSLLTLYLPTRELVSCGNQPSILKGIIFVDPKLVQGHRIYAQLTLTFRYGREDEEVMGLRFCNEAIMSLHQVWPRSDELMKDSLTPLQDALMKRLGDGAHPFTLSLTPQAPPSVQLVPAKRYYGAPIGTSYDVRCFIGYPRKDEGRKSPEFYKLTHLPADKSDEKFHRRATVKMGIRVIHRTDVSSSSGPENFATLLNNQSPPPHDNNLASGGGGGGGGSSTTTAPSSSGGGGGGITSGQPQASSSSSSTALENVAAHQLLSSCSGGSGGKSKKSERMDSFPKIRLSPKSFRFSSRFGRSKSEVERGPSDPFYNYNISFQYESCGGPQGAVDKPFLLQEGRVGLRANLDKSWYTHGEDVIVTVNIKNDSRKTVRRMRVCAIQHVDVCMFNNGKFKNIVADSDTGSGQERTVGPGSSLNATFILRPKRGPTKNWIALEDSLQRCSEPDEITGAIAASAIRTPTVTSSTSPDDRNVFAIYVSYYVKVKLTLSGMGGELSLKLPFALVHVDQPNKHLPSLSSSDVTEAVHKLTLDEAGTSSKGTENEATDCNKEEHCTSINQIETIEEDVKVANNNNNNKSANKRKLIRHSTVKEYSSDEGEKEEIQTVQVVATPPPKTPTTSTEPTPKTQTNDGAGSSKRHRPSKSSAGDEDDDDDDDDEDDESCSQSQPKNGRNGVQQTTCVQIHTHTS